MTYTVLFVRSFMLNVNRTSCKNLCRIWANWYRNEQAWLLTTSDEYYHLWHCSNFKRQVVNTLPNNLEVSDSYKSTRKKKNDGSLIWKTMWMSPLIEKPDHCLTICEISYRVPLFLRYTSFLKFGKHTRFSDSIQPLYRWKNPGYTKPVFFKMQAGESSKTWMEYRLQKEILNQTIPRYTNTTSREAIVVKRWEKFCSNSFGFR